jgi:hypothetical protein
MRTTLGGVSTDDREQVLAQAVAGRLMAGVPLMGGTLGAPVHAGRQGAR